MSYLILLPHFAAGLFFWPLFLLFKRDAPALSRQLRTIFLVTLAVNVVAIVTAMLIGNHQVWNSQVFPFLNLFSLMASAWTCMGKGRSNVEWTQEPRYAAVLAASFIGVIGTLMMGGFIHLDIFFEGVRTTATTVPNPSEHRVIKYEYSVAGRTYTGSGDPGYPPYPPGSTFEIRYSASHPMFSCAEPPLLRLGQLAFGCAFVSFGAWSITTNAKKRAAAARLKS